ncbi:MAG: protein kinase, partial [Myxococcota bacterium]
MVNPEATHRLIRVFEAALERPEPERRDYVAQACGADEELERQILAMLDADSAPDDGFLEGLPEPEGGQIWGQYELLEPIGEGGMGRVFRGRHRTIGRAVAIKVLNPELAHEPELVSRFLQEASIVNAVRHPSIIDVTDFIRLESPPRVAYVMELLSGVPLSTPLRDGALASSEVLNIAWQVLDALEAVHDAGVTHRDLKPDNIFVSGDLAAGGSPIKVLDFGVAKVSTSNEHLTATGAILGTPAYMAPEQALGQKVGPPADLYAWAAIVYEMLIGQRLFSGSAASILHQKIAGEAPELHRDGVATELRPLVDLLQKLLSPRPEVRPGARESKQLLRQLGASTGHAAHRTVLAAQAEAFEGFTSRAQAAATSHGGTLVPRAGSVVTVWFDHARRAVDFARELRGRAIDDAASQPLEREARMGIWTGQVYLRDQDLQGAEGLVLDGALRLMSMARPGQTLMSGAAADQARQQASSRPFEWVSHGVYGFAELPVPVELYEPIEPGASAFPAPATAPDAWREGETPATSWRPGPGLSVPGRAGWILRRRLGEGGFGEVWLAEHEELEKAHMFKFCFAAGPRRALAREVALGARLKRALGERTDILPVLESELGDPPYYLEGPYLSGGDLKAWLRAHQPEVSTELRLELVAQAADALAAAHSVGIIHRDIKPSNILIDDAGPSPRVVLADFGVGGLVEDTPDPVALADTVLNGAS